MRSILLAGAALVCVGLTSCAAIQSELTTAAATPAGQLFCSVDGIVVAVAENVAGDVTGAAAPIAVLATNATAQAVQDACASAAKATGAKVGLPVSPPSDPSTVATVTIPAGSAS